ncbi:MAG: hypothetical protein QMD23_02320 [Candidatus Bathyarchaeia archaeon]|nr:hypothetical protein [Candidatus Bathyarchaeia archaeon]
MTKNIFFVVHDEESYEKHPDLIGFYVKTDLDGKPMRNARGELIPEHSTVNEIRPKDRVIYYTQGDHLIRGIFEVTEKLKEGDARRAKDWTRGLVQFVIELILKPRGDVDFRNIIFSGKDSLEMFGHLDNLKKQWGMSIGGRNYIRKISLHDFEIIEKALRHTLKLEAKEEEGEIPKFPRVHLATQFKLVKILKSYRLKVHVARNDKVKMSEKGEDVLESIPEFHNERICDIASRIDCVAFSESNVPRILIEVVDTPATLTESLYRLNEVALVYPRSEEQRFYMVGPETLRNNFNEKIESLTFKSLKDVNCMFKPYQEVNELFMESQKKKPKL